MPAFHAEFGMPCWLELLSSSPAKSTYFYEQLFGWDFEGDSPLEGYRIGRKEGLPVIGVEKQPENAVRPDMWVEYFRVGDLATATQRVEELGGRVLVGKQPAPYGQRALVVDPAGAIVGLYESADTMFVAGGEPGLAVWHENLIMLNREQTKDFYTGLFDWSLIPGDGVDVALADGAAFAALVDAAGLFPKEFPSSWQVYFGVRNVHEAVSLAQRYGGEVIRAPWDAEFGRLAVIADPTGTALTLCEVEDAPIVEPHEGDNILP